MKIGSAPETPLASCDGLAQRSPATALNDSGVWTSLPTNWPKAAAYRALTVRDVFTREC